MASLDFVSAESSTSLPYEAVDSTCYTPSVAFFVTFVNSASILVLLITADRQRHLPSKRHRHNDVISTSFAAAVCIVDTSLVWMTSVLDGKLSYKKAHLPCLPSNCSEDEITDVTSLLRITVSGAAIVVILRCMIGFFIRSAVGVEFGNIRNVLMNWAAPVVMIIFLNLREESVKSKVLDTTKTQTMKTTYHLESNGPSSLWLMICFNVPLVVGLAVGLCFTLVNHLESYSSARNLRARNSKRCQKRTEDSRSSFWEDSYFESIMRFCFGVQFYWFAVVVGYMWLAFGPGVVGGAVNNEEPLQSGTFTTMMALSSVWHLLYIIVDKTSHLPDIGTPSRTRVLQFVYKSNVSMKLDRIENGLLDV